jgi:autophagy-related protein 5
MGLGSGAGNNAAASANTTLFRRLIWEGSVPLEIRIDQKELPADSDRGLGESYYLQVRATPEAYLQFRIGVN